MSRNHGKNGTAPLIARLMEVAMANTAKQDVNQYIIIPERSSLQLP